MLTVWEADTIPARWAVLLEDEVTPVNLTGATVTVRVQGQKRGSEVILIPATVLDPLEGLIEHDTSALTAGFYNIAARILQGGVTQTSPTEKNAVLRVRAV